MTPEMLATLTEQVAELVQTYSNNYLLSAIPESNL